MGISIQKIRMAEVRKAMSRYTKPLPKELPKVPPVVSDKPAFVRHNR